MKKQVISWLWLVAEASIGATIVHFQDLDLVWAPIIVASLQVLGKEINKKIQKDLSVKK